MGGQSVGGFFFWADGDIRRESPYEEFLFDQERLPAADQCIMSSPDRFPPGDCGPARPGWPSPQPATAGNPEDNINTAPPRTPASDRRPSRPAWPGRDPARVENPEQIPGLTWAPVDVPAGSHATPSQKQTGEKGEDKNQVLRSCPRAEN